MMGTLPYFRLLLRTRWPLLLVVSVTMLGVIVFTATSMVERYTTQASLDAYAAGYDAASGVAPLVGRGQNLDTLGGATANEVAVIALLLYPVLGVLLGVGLSRAIENGGLLDIISAGRLSPSAPIVASALAAGLSMLIFCVAATTILLVMGYPTMGSIAWTLALALFTFSMAAMSLLVAQIAAAPPEAYGLSIAVAMALYLIRVLTESGSDASIAWNPQSWLAEATPWADRPTLWPYVAYLLLAIVLVALAVAVRGRRDHDAGLIAPRQGRSTAAEWIRTAPSLQAYMAMRNVIVWCLGSMIFAWVLASISNDMASINLTVGVGEQTNRGEIDQLVVLFTQVNAILAMGCGLTCIASLRDEETSGRAEWVVSTGVSRRAWWLSATGVAMGSALVVLLATGVATALGVARASGIDGMFADAFTATLAYAPAVLIAVGIGAFLCAIQPRLSALAWAIPGIGLYVALRGEASNLSGIVRGASPLSWLPSLPVEQWQAFPPLVMLGFSLAIVAISSVLFNRRDLNAHAG